MLEAAKLLGISHGPVPVSFRDAARATGDVNLTRGIEILEGALAIGRQAERLAPEIASARMDAVKDQAETATSVEDRLFSKIKAWFTAEKVVEPAA